MVSFVSAKYASKPSVSACMLFSPCFQLKPPIKTGVLSDRLSENSVADRSDFCEDRSDRRGPLHRAQPGPRQVGPRAHLRHDARRARSPRPAGGSKFTCPGRGAPLLRTPRPRARADLGREGRAQGVGEVEPCRPVAQHQRRLICDRFLGIVEAGEHPCHLVGQIRICGVGSAVIKTLGCETHTGK